VQRWQQLMVCMKQAGAAFGATPAVVTETSGSSATPSPLPGAWNRSGKAELSGRLVKRPSVLPPSAKRDKRVKSTKRA
jgi:hypothetical protein